KVFASVITVLRPILRAVATSHFPLLVAGLAFAALFMLASPAIHAQTQQARLTTPVPERYQGVDASDDATIEDLIQKRIEEEWKAVGVSGFNPELVRTEANYA